MGGEGEPASGGGKVRERRAGRAGAGARERRGGPKGRRPFQIGKAISRGFSAWFGNFIPFEILAALIFAPHAALLWYTAAVEHSPEGAQALNIAGFALSSLLQVVLEAALVYGVFQKLRGQRAGLGATLAKGFARMLPAIGASVASAVLIFGPVLFSLVFFAVHPLLGFVAMCGGLIVTAILRLIFYVTVPVIVVEGGNVVAALIRSAALTKRCRLDIFGLLVLLGLIQWLVLCVGNVATLGAATAMESPLVAALGTWSTAVFLAPLNASVTAVIYHDLRVQKEGVGIEELAAVFD